MQLLNPVVVMVVVSVVYMGLINKVDMVCLSPVGYGVWLTFRALALRRSRQSEQQSAPTKG